MPATKSADAGELETLKKCYFQAQILAGQTRRQISSQKDENLSRPKRCPCSTVDLAFLCLSMPTPEDLKRQNMSTSKHYLRIKIYAIDFGLLANTFF